MREPKRNMAASVQARLLKLAKERNRPFDLLLTRYVLERLLYRLGTTRHRDQFVLKGALLLTAWFDYPLRPTRDLDLLSLEDSDAQALLGIFRDICAVPAADGVVFDTESMEINPIREAQEFAGLRLRAVAKIGAARIRVVVDVGFGDAIEPPAAEIELPVLGR
jgi:hypothetical protein